MLAHQAAAAAAEQGKFSANARESFAQPTHHSRERLLAFARQLNLDMDRFSKDLDSPRIRASIVADRQEGDRLGIDGHPSFFKRGNGNSGP